MTKLQTNEPTLYLYSRVSTTKQTKSNKTGMDRQQNSKDVQATRERFSHLPEVEFNDAGLSAHHGHNFTKGKMGAFLELAQSGAIAWGSVLAMEDIDRLTRLKLTDAHVIVSTILQKGIQIYTWKDGVTYSKDNLMSHMQITLQLEGANVYSKKLSSRIKEIPSTILREKINKGIRDKGGYCPAIRGYASHKWWVETSSYFVKPHPEYFEVARIIVDLILEGHGHVTIRRILKEKGIRPPRKASKKKGIGWGQNLISRFHKSRTLIGEHSIMIDGERTIIPDYYPHVCTVEEFHEMARIKKANRSKVEGVKKNIGLLSGAGKTRCSCCEMTMGTFLSKARTPYETMRYKCSGKDDAGLNCKTATIDSKTLETAVIKMVGTIIAVPPKKDNLAEILSTKARISEAQQEIETYQFLLKEAKGLDAKRVVIEELNKNTKAKGTQEHILAELMSIPDADPLAINDIPRQVVNYKRTDIREDVRHKLFSHVEAIKIKASTNVVDIYIKLYSGNEIQATLLNRQYLYFRGDEWFDMYHKPAIKPLENNTELNKVLFDSKRITDSPFGGVKAMTAANDWYGIDKKGNQVQVLNLDDIYISKRHEIMPVFMNFVRRLAEGEDLLISNVPQELLDIAS
jgi:DNA invertase Pin-like site-specific DNA recombinase